MSVGYFFILCQSVRYFDTVGLPGVKWCGTEGEYTAMVIDLLGRSLEIYLRSQIYLIDMELVKQYCDPRIRHQIAYKEGKESYWHRSLCLY